MYPVPAEVYDFLAQHPHISGAELARQLGIPDRSARRYRNKFLSGKADRREGFYQTRVTSLRMMELEDEDDTFDAQAFFELAPKLIKQAQRRDPVIVHDDFAVNTDRPIGVLFASCMHLGGRYTAYEEFRDLYDRALQIDGLYWGSLGDDIEGFMAHFPDVASVDDQLLNVRNQLQLLEAVLAPLAESNRLLFGCGSQHGGAWERKRTGRNPVKELYLSLNVPFFDGVGYVRFRVGKSTYFIALAHELPGDSMWNPTHAHTRAARFRFPMADVVVAGDKHSSAIQRFPMFLDEYLMGNRESPFVWLIQAGTAKTGPDVYTVSRWPMGEFGWPIVIFHPDKHHIEVVFDLGRAKEILGG